MDVVRIVRRARPRPRGPPGRHLPGPPDQLRAAAPDEQPCGARPAGGRGGTRDPGGLARPGVGVLLHRRPRLREGRCGARAGQLAAHPPRGGPHPAGLRRQGPVRGRGVPAGRRAGAAHAARARHAGGDRPYRRRGPGLRAADVVGHRAGRRPGSGDRSRRRGRADLHQWHHRPAQGSRGAAPQLLHPARRDARGGPGLGRLAARRREPDLPAGLRAPRARPGSGRASTPASPTSSCACSYRRTRCASSRRSA